MNAIFKQHGGYVFVASWDHRYGILYVYVCEWVCVYVCVFVYMCVCVCMCVYVCVINMVFGIQTQVK